MTRSVPLARTGLGRRGARLAAAAACAILLAGCSGSDAHEPAPPEQTGASGTVVARSPGPSGAPGAIPTETIAADCRDAPGRTVTQLPDVLVPAVDVPEVRGTGESGTPEVLLPEATVAGQLVDAGCVVAYDAPGGCLGAVEITAASIPAATIPGGEVPGFGLEDGPQVGTLSLGAVTAPAVAAPAVRTEQVCQIELDGELPTVSRKGVVREGVARSGIARPGATRPGQCSGEVCIEALRVEAVRLDPVRLPDVDVDPGRLRSQDLTVEVDVITGDGSTAFVAPGDVLFDTDQSAIRPGAEPGLRAIADQIVALSPGGALRVEGHTDDVGEVSYNLGLSQARAQAVADWLVANAGIDPARLSVTGLGETSPAFPNDSDGNRQLNRRVVITLAGP